MLENGKTTVSWRWLRSSRARSGWASGENGEMQTALCRYARYTSRPFARYKRIGRELELSPVAIERPPDLGCEVHPAVYERYFASVRINPAKGLVAS